MAFSQEKLALRMCKHGFHTYECQNFFGMMQAEKSSGAKSINFLINVFAFSKLPLIF
jgi:hypothetical protein